MHHSEMGVHRIVRSKFFLQGSVCVCLLTWGEEMRNWRGTTLVGGVCGWMVWVAYWLPRGGCRSAWNVTVDGREEDTYARFDC